MKKIKSIFLALLLWSIVGNALAVNRMTGLREGRVYIKTENSVCTAHLKYRPVYGWDEPVLLFAPDGRMIAADQFGHNASGSKTYRLDHGKGIYTFLLKPSYVYSIQTTATGMVFSQEAETVGLYRTIKDHPLIFKIPDTKKKFSIFFTNIERLKARKAKFKLYNPAGEIVAIKKRPGMNPEQIIEQLTGLSQSDLETGQRGSDLSLATIPDELKADSVEIDKPENGFWSVRTGATGLRAYKVGIWLKGVPSFFAAAREYWFEPIIPKKPVKASIQIDSMPLNKRPFIGFVGHMGDAGSPDAKKLKNMGQQGDKLFLYQEKMMPAGRGFAFPHQERFNPDHNVFSLIVFRKESRPFRNKDAVNRLVNLGLWSRKTARYLIGDLGRNPESFALQVLNEPNLETTLSEYLVTFQTSARAVKKKPGLAEVRFAGPGLGAGEENSIIDWQWLRSLIRRADPWLDIVTWNMYRIKNIEDTFLFTNAVQKTDQIIHAEDRDGQIEDIIIGAANREGGLANDRLFNSWESAIWWASSLTRVINTGKAAGIYYYNLIDKGEGRNKGMFTASLEPKPQAYINRVFAKFLESDEIYRLVSNHSALEGIAAKNENNYRIILINKSRRYISVESDLFKNKNLQCRRLAKNGAFTEMVIHERPLLAPMEILIINF